MLRDFDAVSFRSCCLALALLAVPARAATVLSDSFDYPDGAIVGGLNSPWQNHSGTAGTALVVSGNLELLSSRSEDINALLAGQPYAPGSAMVFYAGFTVRFSALPSAAGTYFAHFKDGSLGFRGRLWVSTTGAPAGQFRLGIGNSSNATASSGQLTNDLALNTAYTVVTRYDVANGLSTIWLNPQAESDPSVTATDATSPVTITSFAFRQASGMGALLVDDLKVGTAFGDVVTTVTNDPPSQPYEPRALSVLTYNVKGNGASDWSTNAPQVRAIGRQMAYLSPDVITFQEVPHSLSYEMTNFVKAFLPGYFLAQNSGTDGSIRSMIASRFPIVRSAKWLDGIDLKPFGYTNTASAAADNFTRDLFEAEITVPHFPQRLHVFTTHLKSTAGTSYADAAAKRAAEAAAITNFFATNLFVLHPNRPYLLTGDLNDANTNALAIQRLVGAPAGLRLTNPTNPVTGSINTFSIQSGNPNSRLDYIMPGWLLATNMAGSQVFRTDRLDPVPPGLLGSDSATASDHLPVLMVFNNPYDAPLRITSMARTGQAITLNWRSSSNRTYRVDASTNLADWSPLASNLKATGTNFGFSTNVAGSPGFFRVHLAP